VRSCRAVQALRSASRDYAAIGLPRHAELRRQR
jgi:hypothetical protein